MKKIKLYDINTLKEKSVINKKHTANGIILGIGLLLTSLSITGCMSPNSNIKSTSTLSSQLVMENETATTSLPKTTTSDNTFNQKEISLSPEEAITFQQYLNSIDTIYTYEELYGIDEALEKEKQTVPRATKHLHAIQTIDGKFNTDTIVEQVIKNNKNYLESENISAYKKASLKELNSAEIESIISIIVEVLNQELDTNQDIDSEELKCVIGDLKIFSSPSSSNALVNDDNCLIISPNMINIAQIMDNKKDAKKDILIHEAMHLVQKSCKDNEDKEKTSKIGISQYWTDLKVNPLKWNWFYEASAEKEMCNLTGDSAVTYKYLISYLDSLSMATILNDNVKANQTERLCFQKNPERLYEQFNCNSIEEQKEIIKLMYTIDILQYEREDFYNQYNPIYGEIDSEEQLVVLQRNLKTSICETLTRKFYESLSSQMTKQSICIDDMNYLIRVFEADINSHLDCENKDKAQENIPFMERYLEIQNNFFQGIADSNQMLIEEVIENYNNYTLQPSEQLLTSLEPQKREFVKERLSDVNSRATYNISQMRQLVASETMKKTK